MLNSRQQKQDTKAEAQKKVEAWRTINSVLVQQNAKFMSSLRNILADKEAGLETLKEKLSKGEGTEEENASLIFQAGYVQALKDILGIKNGQ